MLSGPGRFAASLRQEFRYVPTIHVYVVSPSIIDTPGCAHGANMSGRALELSGRIYPPEDVAARIMDLVKRPRDEVAVGWPARAAQAAYALAPGPTEHLMGAAVRRYLREALSAPENRRWPSCTWSQADRE